MTPLVSISGIHLVNSTGTPVAGGAATGAATTPFSIRKGWRPATAEPIAVFSSGLAYPDIHYEPVPETIPFSIAGTTHENAVTRLQELERALMRANGMPAILNIQPTSSSNAIQAEITNAVVRLVTEEQSGFEAWEGFTDLHAEIVCTRSPLFGRPPAQGFNALLSFATFTNTGTGANPNTQAFPVGLDGDLANEGQPTYLNLAPLASGANTIFYVATVESRTYSTTGSGAKTTPSITGAFSALSAPSLAATQAKLGLKARVLFRFTNCTANAQVRVEVRANTSGTVLFAGPWVSPTAASATLYDMGRIPIELLRAAPRAMVPAAQLYIGYRSTDGSSATATLGYSEFLLYYDFCRIDSPTPVNSASGSQGYSLDMHAFLDDNWGGTGAGRPLLPLDVPIAFVYDNFLGGVLDVASIRGRPPRAIEGGSLYLAWMTAGNVHDTTKTARIDLLSAALWRTLRGSD